MSTVAESESQNSRSLRIVVGLIAVHTVLIGWCAWRNSFCWTESGLLPTGVLDWRYTSFDVFRVNPPLVRMWATSPVMALNPDIPFEGVSADPRRRAEWTVAKSMINSNGQEAWTWLFVSRLWCLPFVWAGMWTAWRWSTRLYGKTAGVGCVIIWTFSPLMIGYGSLISGDGQAASMGLVTLYVFRAWIRAPDLYSTYILGFIAGLTVLTKTSWMALFGLLPLLWLVIRSCEYVGRLRSSSGEFRIRSAVRETGLAIGSMVICVLVINLAYGFDGSFRRLDSFDFISKALAGDENWRETDFRNNRFRESWTGMLPVPLPEDMVIGMDLQKWDFDRERFSYFKGEWRNQGRWYYYIFALAVKGPLGIWCVGLVSVLTLRRKRLAPWQDTVILLLPVLIILAAASAETGLNRHARYVLPVIPLTIVLLSRVIRILDSERIWIRRSILAALTWFVLSSLWIYPHSHSYFNELVGGPLHAVEHLNASNLDWGQDLKYVKAWCERNPEKRPVFLKSYLHLIDPVKMGIPSEGAVPNMPIRDGEVVPAIKAGRYKKGWYIIDNESLVRKHGDFLYLKSLPAKERIGYGFRVYEITDENVAQFERLTSEVNDDK